MELEDFEDLPFVDDNDGDGETMFDNITDEPSCPRCAEPVEADDTLCEICEEEFINENPE